MHVSWLEILKFTLLPTYHLSDFQEKNKRQQEKAKEMENKKEKERKNETESGKLKETEA